MRSPRREASSGLGWAGPTSCEAATTTTREASLPGTVAPPRPDAWPEGSFLEVSVQHKPWLSRLVRRDTCALAPSPPALQGWDGEGPEGARGGALCGSRLCPCPSPHPCPSSSRPPPLLARPSPTSLLPAPPFPPLPPVPCIFSLPLPTPPPTPRARCRPWEIVCTYGSPHPCSGLPAALGVTSSIHHHLLRGAGCGIAAGKTHSPPESLLPAAAQPGQDPLHNFRQSGRSNQPGKPSHMWARRAGAQGHGRDTGHTGVTVWTQLEARCGHLGAPGTCCTTPTDNCTRGNYSP